MATAPHPGQVVWIRAEDMTHAAVGAVVGRDGDSVRVELGTRWLSADGRLQGEAGAEFWVPVWKLEEVRE